MEAQDEGPTPYRRPLGPRCIGVTGGVATGKSTVMRLLKAKGATTFSADEAARAILTPQGSVLQEIVAGFGAEMQCPDGTLNRTRLGEVIFADPFARQQLERITHPPLLRLLRAQMEAVQEDFPPTVLVAVEVPLLFETHLEHWFELIVVVSASETVQIARLRARNGLSEAEALQRLQAQGPLQDKIARAHYVIQNDESPEGLATGVTALWNFVRFYPPKPE